MVNYEGLRLIRRALDEVGYALEVAADREDRVLYQLTQALKLVERASESLLDAKLLMDGHPEWGKK